MFDRWQCCCIFEYYYCYFNIYREATTDAIVFFSNGWPKTFVDNSNRKAKSLHVSAVYCVYYITSAFMSTWANVFYKIYLIIVVIWRNFGLSNVHHFCNTNVINIDHSYALIGILWISGAVDPYGEEMVPLIIVLIIIVQNMMKQRVFVLKETSKLFMF